LSTLQFVVFLQFLPEPVDLNPDDGIRLGIEVRLRPRASTPIVYSLISSVCSSRALVARNRSSCCRVGAL
jgi:hypothetical protein